VLTQGDIEAMQISSNFSTAAIEALRGGSSTAASNAVEASSATSGIVTPTDQIDISAEAQSILSGSKVTGGIRTDKVADIRRQIAAGTYDTEEKMSAALDKFLGAFN